MSNLIASLWRAQTFAYLAYHLSWFLFGSSPCWILVLVVIFMTSPSSPKTDFVWKTCCVFVLKVLPVFRFIEVLPFYIWFYLPLLDYDVSMHDLTVLVVVIPTSPRTSKTEFVCSRYLRFRVRCCCSFFQIGRAHV